ncbi:MAG TPA: 3-dehydroquinate synthase II [Candidatus Syntrophoarchaeum butanivorans]|uniref:3-dehydroquinate synthase n=1 Tax=Candidatus Syntropharchaeum butanivorans TaxID=1839936 RepID=A0A1F2P5G9_9EURY|nr:MAG: 3-dehydroquinate synthase, prokaryotic-type [Candidatus Syntrophoarchaeum butanivorans]HEC56653.1 3-dehydroquinate synthase II [Candidatus Syntrophoarchaeum butanivorans]
MSGTKEVWVRADEGTWDEYRKPRITTALESGVDCVLVEESDVERVRELGKIKVAAFGDNPMADVIVIGKRGEGDGTLEFPVDLGRSKDLETLKELSREGYKVASYVIIKNKDYERLAAELAKASDYLIVIGTDWKVIPLENLIAELQGYDCKIIAGVKDADEAKLALETLEHGADGVLLDADDPAEIKRVMGVVEEIEKGRVPLTPAKVIQVKQLGMGDRVCVDTCSLMETGEGMLIGSASDALFLVHAETEESPYVASRPFRVNAGAVHAYILVGDKTRYLSELKSGDPVMIVDRDGRTRDAVVGRVKIERRPLILIEAEVGDRRFSTILQNAETIKLVDRDGNPISVANIKVGDEVLVYLEEGGRHFGMKVEESILER